MVLGVEKMLMDIAWARRRAKKIVDWSKDHYGLYLLGIWWVILLVILTRRTLS